MRQTIDRDKHFADLLKVTNRIVGDIENVFYIRLKRKGDKSKTDSEEFEYHIDFEEGSVGPLPLSSLKQCWHKDLMVLTSYMVSISTVLSCSTCKQSILPVNQKTLIKS